LDQNATVKRLCESPGSFLHPTDEPKIFNHRVEPQQRHEASILLHPKQFTEVQFGLVAFFKDRELEGFPMSFIYRLLKPAV
jgi:hypothetical protein